MARTMTPSEARDLWRKADAVCFDVDSTVCEDEAIDELARFLGKEAEVRAFTATAMNGSMRFGESLAQRLAIMAVTREQLDAFARQHPVRLTPGVQALVDLLRARNVQVFLVSGGFRSLIAPVAAQLGISADHVFANRLLFDAAGACTGFDLAEPTSDSGSEDKGKAKVCGLLKQRHGFRTLVMVGDGYTDLEASPPADLFIGFGGNQVRGAVEQKAPWFVHSFDELRLELLRAA